MNIKQMATESLLEEFRQLYRQQFDKEPPEFRAAQPESTLEADRDGGRDINLLASIFAGLEEALQAEVDA